MYLPDGYSKAEVTLQRLNVIAQPHRLSPRAGALRRSATRSSFRT